MLAAALIIAGVVSAPPPNDNFLNRALLTGPKGQITGTNTGASVEPEEPRLAEPGGESVWWKWSAPALGLATIHTLGSLPDTQLAVFTGTSFGNLVRIAENDDWDGQDSFQSLVSFNTTAGTEYQILVDGYDGEDGPILLTWSVEPVVAGQPPNNAFAARAKLEGENGRLFATNRGATAEPNEPGHVGTPALRSVWWSWTAPKDGDLTLQTAASSFDTLLAVYTGNALSSLAVAAGDDDGGPDLTSHVDFDVKSGMEYLIAVDGVDGASGLLVLSWLFSPQCSTPDGPASPEPQDGSSGVAVMPLLRWNVRPLLERKVIYGQDDRREIYEVEDPRVVKAWESTVALVSASRDLTDNGDGTYTLPPGTFREFFDLCPDEPYASQPAPAFCSGFLAAPNLVVTAGHCVEGLAACADAAFVFGFRMFKPGQPAMRIPAAQVYRCRGVVAVVDGGESGLEDWAVVELDREVPDHEPLPIRRTGKIANNQALVMIGHPGGLPAKVASGARVRDNSGKEGFLANLDAFAGNSGSAVLNAETLVVEGILVTGEEDFVDTGGCFRSNRCLDSGCSGELSTRITELDHLVPPSRQVSYEVFLGPCGSLESIGSTTEPALAAGPLDLDAIYCWQVVASGECGTAKSPVWTFSTGSNVTTVFLRGDARADGKLNLTDAVAILDYLFGGGTDLSCLKSADADDTGSLDLTDAVYLLGYLFLGGAPPPAPAVNCGVDPTPDDLTCPAHASCAGA